MSYGYGVGDFLAVSKLAWDVYSAYKDAPEDFRNISDEIKSLHIIVDRHKDKFQDKTLSSDEQTQLGEILQGCMNVLGDLDKLHTKYMRLGSAQGSSSQVIDRLKWTQENIGELRARLTSNTTLLNAFIASHTQAEVLSSMEDMKNMLNGLRRRHSVLSLRSVASFAPSVKTKEAMKQLCRDLYRAGVTADVIRDRKDQAVTLFQHPAAPPMDNLGVPRPAGSVAILHGEEPLEERQKGKGRNPTSGTNSTPFRGSALHVAAAIGFRQGVQLLLANGAYIEATRSDDGSTPLDTAAFNGHTEVVRLLLEKGANIEATRSNDGSTPLHTAAYNGHIGMVRLLLEKGANIEAVTSDTGITPLYVAAYYGHTDVVRLLLENGANIEATSTDTRETPLYVAAYNGHTDVVRLLLEKGANIEATRTDTRETPLYVAAYNGHTEVVRLLLEKGANIEATRSNDGSTPLHTAAYNGHIGMVRLLLEKGANIEATTSDTGLTPLDGAAYNGHTDVVRLLLEKGANIEATRSNTGATPLDTAAFNGHIDVVRLLLEKRANIEATRSDGSTALYCASWRGHVGVVSLLLDKGANTEAARTDNESTTLHVAAWYLQTEVVRLLLEKGANIHAASNQAYTALHMVFYVAGVDPHLKDPKQLIPAITVLLAHGANMLQKDEDGDTPLDLAEQCGHPKAKQLFLQHLKERNLKPPQEA